MKVMKATFGGEPNRGVLLNRMTVVRFVWNEFHEWFEKRKTSSHNLSADSRTRNRNYGWHSDLIEKLEFHFERAENLFYQM